MLKNLMIPKDQVICIPETMSCKDAIEMLEDKQLRNAPVVDVTGNLFRGNIYRYHIYKYHFHHPEVDLSQFSVTYLLKNTTKTIYENDSIIDCLFMIKDLPYIVVLSDHHSFQGIILHETLLDFLQQAWVIGDLMCLLAIKSKGLKGDLRKLSRMINRFCDISSAMTFEATDYHPTSYVVYGIPKAMDQIRLKVLLQYLHRRGYEYKVYPM